MAERLPELTKGDSKPLLPTTAAPGPNVKSPDLLSKFLAAREARPDFMTDTLVQTMAVSMAFAGSETTAISLSAVFYFLLKNPSKLARLRAEIDAAGAAGAFSDLETGLVTWHESQKLVYLDACIKEAFRLHPAAGLPLERIVPEGGTEIAGHYVKGGTIVGCSAWVIHKDRGIFGDDAEVYRPERWLPDEKVCEAEAGRAAEDRRTKEMNGTMFQFGMGSRTCIGKNISLLEIYKLVPSMLRRFEVRFFSFLFFFSYHSSLYCSHSPPLPSFLYISSDKPFYFSDPVQGPESRVGAGQCVVRQAEELHDDFQAAGYCEAGGLW